jgi:hypothetical protein
MMRSRSAPPSEERGHLTDQFAAEAREADLVPRGERTLEFENGPIVLAAHRVGPTPGVGSSGVRQCP